MKIPRSVFYFFLWLAVILVGYFFFHIPTSIDQPGAAPRAFYNILVAALAHAVCAGFAGKVYLKRLQPGLASFAVQAAAGAGFASLIWFAMGLLGLFRWWAAAAFMLAGLVAFRGEILAWLRNLLEWRDIWFKSGRFEKSLLALSGVLAINQLWIALSPAVKYDALTYHLALPKIYLESSRFLFLPNNPYWGHPQLVEMVYTWLSAFGTGETAAVYSWWTGVILVCGIAGMIVRIYPAQNPDPHHPPRAAIFGVTALMAGATFRWMFGWSYSDLFSAWFGLAVLYAFFNYQETSEKNWFIWVGVFTGFAVTTKYTAGVIAIAAFGLVWIVRRLRRIDMGTFLVAAVIALLVFAPWLLKNVIYTGNPLFPYIFPTQWYSADRLAAANLPPTGFQWFPQLILPLYITWAGIDSAAGPSTDLGPLLILFAIPALIIYRRNIYVRFLGSGLALVWLAMSLAGSRFGHLQQTRLYFVMLPALAILAGLAWPSLGELAVSNKRIRSVLGFVVLAIMVISVWQDTTLTLASKAIPTALGVTANDDYLDENTGAYIVAMRNLKSLPDSAHVLMAWEARSLYAPSNAAADPWIDNFRAAYRALNDPQKIIQSLQDTGYSHLLVYHPGMQFMRKDDLGIPPEGWLVFDQMLASLPPPQQIGGPYYLLYELNKGP